MNILHLTTFLQGGAGRILTDLALAQKKAGHGVWVLSSKTAEPGYGSYPEYVEKLALNQIPFYQTDSSFKRDLGLNLEFARQVRQLILQYEIDLIHAHASIPALTGLIGRAGFQKYIPVIQTMHGWGQNKSSQQAMMDVTIMNGLDAIVTVSKSDKKLLIDQGVQNSKLEVIYNGIFSEMPHEPMDDRFVQELLEYKRNGYHVLGCIGTVCDRKNQQLLLKAVAQLGGDHSLFCAFIGEGDLIPRLQQEIDRNDLGRYMKFYGYKPEASQYLKCFDLFVLPSTSEGFGLSIVEAFKAGVPVIASDIQVFKELITSGYNGLMFENNNLEDLTRAIREALTMPARQVQTMVENAYQRYISEFSLTKMLDNYQRLYDRLV